MLLKICVWQLITGRTGVGVFSIIGKILKFQAACFFEAKQSGLTYTILRDNIYMEMLPGFIGDKVLETGTIVLPAGEGKSAYVSRLDMAEASQLFYQPSAMKINRINFQETFLTRMAKLPRSLRGLQVKRSTMYHPIPQYS